MKYKLMKNNNGTVTQCENNADGNNIYTQREEINKIALENLQRPTPGKLGELSNLQVFNFSISNILSGVQKVAFIEYNTTETTGNVTDCVMFNVDGLNNKSSYYNLLSVSANVNIGNANSNLLSDSFMQFYILENIEGSTTSLGRKIPRRAPLFSATGVRPDITTTGAKQEYQYISTDFNSDSVTFPTNREGIRCSGLALKTININFLADETIDNVVIDVTVYVDVTSVSNSY